MDTLESPAGVDTRPAKLGLALSGGGFRAAFFHIGMLAALAELGLLRSVEVISSVSGGSHVAALYYLRLKELLESKRDRGQADAWDTDALTNEDYRVLVKAVECEFLSAVSKNIRTRVISNAFKTLRMYSATYSRSDRMAELLNDILFGGEHRMMSLKIQPKGGPPDFHPEVHNQLRKDKVPILLINSTNLVTGHNWRFEAARMGEPKRESALQQIIDKNLRLDRPESWADIPCRLQSITLGDAVAASAAVPSLFHPLAMSDMYVKDDTSDNPEPVRPQLVDGGVHDNQGVLALFDRDCTHFIISDGSGPVEDNLDPSTHFLRVYIRMNSLLMDRVREEVMMRTASEDVVYASHLTQLPGMPSEIAFMHLRRGLPPDRASITSERGVHKPAAHRQNNLDCTTDDFHVPAEVQDHLSRIRTDLDSFSEIESFALMYDAYEMTHFEMSRRGGAFGRFGITRKVPFNWRFRAIAPAFQKPLNKKFTRHLKVAKNAAMKIFRLRFDLTAAVLIATLGPLAYFAYRYRDATWPGDTLRWCYERAAEYLPETQGPLALWIVGIAALSVFGAYYQKLAKSYRLIRRLRSPLQAASRILTRVLLPALIGWIIAWGHMLIFDQMFKKNGRVRTLGLKPIEPPSPERE